MIVRLTKRADGGAVLRCERDDGSVTWQRQDGAQARFFPLHDLVHYAVETTLGARQGFYGLVAAGWDIDDTGGKGVRGPLPDAAIAIEQLVGMLDTERVAGARWTADEVNAQAAAFAANGGRTPPAPLHDDVLDAIRARVQALHGEWHALAPGASLALPFPVTA